MPPYTYCRGHFVAMVDGRNLAKRADVDCLAPMRPTYARL
jgi:hypothetical protein